MKRRALWLCFVTLLLFVAAPAVVAQNPNYNNGPVWRVIYVDVKPGMGDAFWSDIKQNFRPIYDEYKKQGWVVDYKFYTNPVAQHPNDWSAAIAIEYKDWGTLDEMAEKAAAITEKHYGSRQAMMDAAKKRNEFAPTLSSSLAREVTLK
ncbi:MAG TPA: hypothetical protein VFF64_12545 [Candidatus Eremiobacteraceae bacterium]|nr:hypothetical protein [Candidatus Eremiobacteraceae bacterium]